MGTLTNSQSFIFGDPNWKFCKVGYPVGTQKPDVQLWTFLTWDFFTLLFLSEKKCQNLLDIEQDCIRKLGKI